MRPAKSLPRSSVRSSGADGGQHLVAALVAVGVVDLLEVVEVEEDRATAGERAAGLREHALERVVDGAPVRQPGQRVGRGAQLGEREVAQVGEHRRGLGHRVVDAAALGSVGAPPLLDEHRADDLAADEQRLAGRLARLRAADLAGEDLVAASRPGRPARLRRTARQLRGLACSSGSASGSPRAAAMAGSSRSALLLRMRRDGGASGTCASRWRLSRRWPSAWFSATCIASPKRAWEGGTRPRRRGRGALVALRPRRGGACGRTSARRRGEQRADEKRHAHRHERGGPVLLVAADLEAPLVVGVGRDEVVEQAVAVLLVALGRAVGGELALGEALPLPIGRALARHRRELGLVVGGDLRRAAQQRLHAGTLLDVLLERPPGCRVSILASSARSRSRKVESSCCAVFASS